MTAETSRLPLLVRAPIVLGRCLLVVLAVLAWILVVPLLDALRPPQPVVD